MKHLIHWTCTCNINVCNPKVCVYKNWIILFAVKIEYSFELQHHNSTMLLPLIQEGVERWTLSANIRIHMLNIYLSVIYRLTISKSCLICSTLWCIIRSLPYLHLWQQCSGQVSEERQVQQALSSNTLVLPSTYWNPESKI